jgi:hypothetical protein
VKKPSAAVQVINLKDHPERRSRMVQKELAGKTVSSSMESISDLLTY